MYKTHRSSAPLKLLVHPNLNICLAATDGRDAPLQDPALGPHPPWFSRVTQCRRLADPPTKLLTLKGNHLSNRLSTCSLHPVCMLSKASSCSDVLRFWGTESSPLGYNLPFLFLFFFSPSVMSDSLQPHGLGPTRLLTPRRNEVRLLECVAIPFSRGSSWPRNWTRSPALQVYSLPSEPPGKPP